MFRAMNSHSAAERIEAAVSFVHSFPPAAEILIIGASREAVDDFVRSIASSSRATFGLHRFSLAQLAARMATPKVSGVGITPNSAVGTEALATRTAYEASIRKHLKYFDPIVAFPGFARAVSATIFDLRAAGIPAVKLKELNGAGPDIAELLEGFREQMDEAALADRTLLYQAAIEEVHTGAEFAKHPMLFLDVPIHSAIEKAFVVEVAATSMNVLFTCPMGDLRTLENLKVIPRSEEIPNLPKPDDASLSRLRKYLFSESVPPAGETDNEVVLFSAPGEERESIEIARRILAESEKGVPFDRMAILLRAPEIYTTLVEAALDRGGIPAYFTRGIRRPDPSGRALLALLACAAEGLSARRFAEYLSFAQVPDIPDTNNEEQTRTQELEFLLPEDEALSAIISGASVSPQPQATVNSTFMNSEVRQLEGSLRAPWKWERLLVDAAVIGSKDRWARRLKGLEAQFQGELEECAREEPSSARTASISRKLRNLQNLSAFALPIIDALAALPVNATWGDWITEIEHLVPHVLRRPERVLSILADLKAMAPVAGVSLDEVRNVLQNWLSNAQQPSPESRYGRILVATPEQARGRSFDVVFVPGLAENIFPQKIREDPLLLDDLRCQLSSELFVLVDRSQQERLQLQIMVGAATQRLYLSYPRLEVAEARARVPSFYALEIARSITGTVPDHEALAREAEVAGASRLAWPAPRDPSVAIDDAEYDLATLWPLLTTNQPRDGRLAYVMTLNSFLARSLRSRWARWQEGWSQYDGLNSKRQPIIQILNDQRLSARPYSVSSLQNFAVCPYRFLLSSIIRLEPREDMSPLEEMDALTRGALFHRMQAETLRRLKVENLLPPRIAHFNQSLEILDTVVRRVAEEAYEELAPAIERIWLDSIEAIRADLRIWLEIMAKQDNWTPVHFEFGFGFKPNGDRDPQSLRDPVRLATGELIHGIVDLIERSDDGSVLRVTDHKTGKDRTKEGFVVGHGEYLQPVIYGLAIEAAMKKKVKDGRFFFCTTEGGFKERVVELDPNARASAEAILRTIENGISGPFLVPAPREEACAYCDFKEVCGPYEELRIARKQEHVQLTYLKTMRNLP
jgi:CRISPR/Cas system-associated exonuclease Cas4 (RecB family)